MTPIAAGLALCAALLSPAAARAELAGDLAKLLAHEKYTLANGLEVILREERGAPLVAISIWYHVGGRNDPPGKAGLSHLFEHLMFRGSSHVKGGHYLAAGALDAVELGAITEMDRTRYFETVPAGNLETVLWLESDRMGFLLPALSKSALEKEKSAVKNELRQKLENSPYAQVFHKLVQALFTAPHPYHGNIIGTEAEIDTVSLEDAAAFFTAAYAPANATLAIVGDFRTARAKELVEKYFGSLPARPRLVTPAIAPVQLEREVIVQHRERFANLTALVVGWTAPKFFAPGDAAGDILASILAYGHAARLSRRLERTEDLARATEARQHSYLDQSIFRISATLQPGVAPEKVVAAIDEELAELRRVGPTAAEVAAAVARWEVSVASRLDGVRGLARTAEQLQNFNHFFGQPDGLGKDLERYRAVTPEDVRRFAVEVLGPRRAIVIATPEPSARGQLGPEVAP